MNKNRGFGGPPMRQQFPSPTDQKLQQAIGFHQRGMLVDAKRLYEEILKQRPKHFDALHLLGVLACQTKDLARGEALIAQAIKVDPDNAPAYLNRGNALKDLKRLNLRSDMGCHPFDAFGSSGAFSNPGMFCSADTPGRGNPKAAAATPIDCTNERRETKLLCSSITERSLGLFSRVFRIVEYPH